MLNDVLAGQLNNPRATMTPVYEFLDVPLPVQYGDLGRSSRLRKPSGGKKGWPKGRPRKPVREVGKPAQKRKQDPASKSSGERKRKDPADA